jgi:hypothetical protein
MPSSKTFKGTYKCDVSIICLSEPFPKNCQKYQAYEKF